MGLMILVSAPAIAASSPVTEYEYPELMVTPRASARLQTEAARESQNAWVTHIPIQISSLATLTAGIYQLSQSGLPAHSNDPLTSSATDLVGNSGWAGVLVGGGWLVATATLAASYRPYERGLSGMSELPKGTPREQLARERVAEEEIRYAARLGSRLRWLSIASNGITSAYMMSRANRSGASFLMDGIALVLSVTPAVFRYHWQDVAEEQSEYKKRIYAPIASLDIAPALLLAPKSKEATPGLLASFAF